jgi:kinesin family protein 2/24
MISKQNFEARSVTVEWYERGETKGKEVELAMLLELNDPAKLQIMNDATIVPQSQTNVRAIHSNDHIKKDEAPREMQAPTNYNLARVSISNIKKKS